jgi:hypothetical protein
MRLTVAINSAVFLDPEEGRTATVDRLVMAASHHRVSPDALEALVGLTAMACDSGRVLSMTPMLADIEELENLSLLTWGARDVVVLL